jgi:hypothetical protein
MVTAWVRSLASSLTRIFFTWPLTVSSVIESSAAISLFAFPAPIRSLTRHLKVVKLIEPQVPDAYYPLPGFPRSAVKMFPTVSTAENQML